jgi:hypothetical protein
MRKYIVLVCVAGLLITFTSCVEKKQGKLTGGYHFKELTTKEKEDEKMLFDGDVLTEVILNTGDTIHAAISQKKLAEKLAKNDLDVEVSMDGKNNDFYFIEQ